MLEFLQKRINDNKGFTLIELIVVISILGILAGIAVPRLGNFTSDAKDSAKEATLRTIQSAYSIYEAENDSSKTFPDNYLEGYYGTPSANEIKYEIGDETVTYEYKDDEWSIK